MAEHLKSATNYKGFIIREVILGAPMMSGRAIKPMHKDMFIQWRITTIDGDQFITCMTKQAAEQKIDSGEAKKELELLRKWT